MVSLFILPQHAKGESFDLGEFFQALPRKQHAQVWTALLLLTQSAVDTLSEMVGEDECKVGSVSFRKMDKGRAKIILRENLGGGGRDCVRQCSL